ncbi:hypothetical protein [Streptomyces iconiensis]|uniref:Uncharacterized protein n=1 Tax=Streptomyces iconiensis TaxID=1384038 RepID=A0ABT7AAK0_9ACTN|nr:hypothetical protein [Streptomyces iconiensis]MDJ1138377.1 hypothetical protein [Streptomyces iconiensis]
MNHRIRHALSRTLALLIRPRGSGAAQVGAPYPPVPHEAVRTTPVRPPRRPLDAPATVDGDSPLVRPYLLAHERGERRAALVLALDGIDIGPEIIHGHHIGHPAVAMGVAA